MRLGAYDAAVAPYERPLEVDSARVELWHNLGKVHVKRDDAAAAEAAFARVIAADTTQAGAHGGLGALYLAAGRYQEARGLAQTGGTAESLCGPTALRSGPGLYANGRAGVGAGAIGGFARLEEEKKMVKSLEFTLLNERDNARRHYDLGVLYGQRRQFARAAERYRRAIALDPDFAVAHVNLGNIYFRQERYDEAQVSFERALAADSTHANAYNSLGNLHMVQGDFSAAAMAFARAGRLDPDNGEFKRNLKIARGLKEEKAP